MKSLRSRVIAAVINRGDLFLVCRRPLAKRYGGLWEFPGGKCEIGESDADAIQRELREELDVEATEVFAEEFATSDPNGEFLLIFRPVRIKGDPARREHTDLRWLPLHELLRLPLIEGDRKYVEFRLARSKSEEQARVSELT